MRVVYVLFLLYAWPCMAQQMPPFKALRYDEDYRFLQRDSSNVWYHRLKYSALSDDHRIYASAGGDIRYQYLYFNNENWGDAAKDRDGYVLSRYLFHGDLHITPWFRAFAQLQSSMINGKAATSGVDEDPLEIHQAFADINFIHGKKDKLVVRLGRQELLYGSQRLISVRDGPNNRQSFDGAKLLLSHDVWQADLLYMHPVKSKKGLFDDGYNRDVKLWGAYLAHSRPGAPLNADLYYWGFRRAQSVLDDGSQRELRHSIGSRLWATVGGWRYDAEGVWQFGEFGDKTIAAWTLSLNTGYKFRKVVLQPELGIKTEWISGDAAYGDGKLQTFNPLFPRGGYFGLAAIIGPSNLFDVHPSLTLDLTRKLFFNMDYDVFWRYSENDGIYGPGGGLLYSGKGIADKHIGRQLSFDLSALPNSFLYLRAEFTFFSAGGFLQKASAGKDMLFAAFTSQFRF